MRLTATSARRAFSQAAAASAAENWSANPANQMATNTIIAQKSTATREDRCRNQITAASARSATLITAQGSAVVVRERDMRRMNGRMNEEPAAAQGVHPSSSFIVHRSPKPAVTIIALQRSEERRVGK